MRLFTTSEPNDANLCGRTVEVQNRKRLRPAIRIHQVGLAACEDNKVALGQAELPSLFEREGRRAATELVEQGVGPRRQRQTPRMTKHEVAKQRPAESNAIQHFGQDVHAPNAIPADGQTQYSDDLALLSENSSD